MDVNRTASDRSIKVLSNFNSLLNNRDINVDLYDRLLLVPKENFVDELLKVNGERGDVSRHMRKLLELDENDYHNGLTTIVRHNDMNIFIYWSVTGGKVLKKDEIKRIGKVVNDEDVQYVFVVTTYDKIAPDLDSVLVNAEFFTFRNLAFDLFKHIMCPRAYVIEYNEFVSNNPYMKNRILPYIFMNDPLVRYVGGRPGQVLAIERDAMLDTGYMNRQLSFRRVNNRKDKELEIATGISIYD